MTNNEADEVTGELSKSLLNRYQNNLEKLIKGSEFVHLFVHFMSIYCIINVKK